MRSPYSFHFHSVILFVSTTQRCTQLGLSNFSCQSWTLNRYYAAIMEWSWTHCVYKPIQIYYMTTKILCCFVLSFSHRRFYNCNNSICVCGIFHKDRSKRRCIAGPSHSWAGPTDTAKYSIVTFINTFGYAIQGFL